MFLLNSYFILRVTYFVVPILVPLRVAGGPAGGPGRLRAAAALRRLLGHSWIFLNLLLAAFLCYVLYTMYDVLYTIYYILIDRGLQAT